MSQRLIDLVGALKKRAQWRDDTATKCAIAGDWLARETHNARAEACRTALLDLEPSAWSADEAEALARVVAAYADIFGRIQALARTSERHGLAKNYFAEATEFDRADEYGRVRAEILRFFPEVES